MLVKLKFEQMKEMRCHSLSFLLIFLLFIKLAI